MSNSAMVENGILFDRASDGNYFGGEETEEEIVLCDACALEKREIEMSEIEGICFDCVDKYIEDINYLILTDVSDGGDNNMWRVFTRMTEVFNER